MVVKDGFIPNVRGSLSKPGRLWSNKTRNSKNCPVVHVVFVELVDDLELVKFVNGTDVPSAGFTILVGFPPKEEIETTPTTTIILNQILLHSKVNSNIKIAQIPIT